jgi:hypothetical protein
MVDGAKRILPAASSDVADMEGGSRQEDTF